MALISIDNGQTYQTAAEAMPEIMARNLWDATVELMDDATREQVHHKFAPCSEGEFLAAYLAAAEDDLIIG